MKTLISNYENSLDVRSLVCSLHSLAIGRLLKVDGKKIEIIEENELKKFKGYRTL